MGVSLFHKYAIPKDFDFLSVDVDGIDFFVLHKILCSGDFKPRVIMVEYNSHIPSTAGAYVTPYKTALKRCIGYCNGMSLGAVKLLGNKFGYELVYTIKAGVNAVLVRKDI